MFEHLDDPAGFDPAPDFRQGALRRGRLRKLRRRLAGGSALAIVAVAGVAGAALVRVDHQLDRVDRVEVVGLPEAEPTPADPYTVLVVGSDARHGTDVDPAADVAGSRADTMIVARVVPDEAVTVLPLPRDLWVTVPGKGPGRLNSALSAGGPSLLIATLREDLGITVDRYVELDFAGTRAIGDAIGGLRLSFPSPVRDLRSGLALDAGCRPLGGADLLSLARSRHLQHLDGDRWVGDPTSDLGRIERQQAIAVAGLAALSHVDTSSPGQLDDLLGAIASNLTVDERTSNRELVALFRGVAGARIDQVRLPVLDEVHGGADVLVRAAGSDAALAAVRGGSDQLGPTTTLPGADGPTTSTSVAATSAPPAAQTTAAFVPTPC